MQKVMLCGGNIWADTGLRAVGTAFTGRVADTGSVQVVEAAAVREAAAG